MKKIAKIIKSSKDGKRHIAVDTNNADEILKFLTANNLVKKFELICGVVLLGFRNSDLYDKEDINKRCRHVTAMKFKGNINARIYCKEINQENRTLIIVAAELLPGKKNQKNRQKEVNLIEKVAGYDFEIQK